MKGRWTPIGKFIAGKEEHMSKKGCANGDGKRPRRPKKFIRCCFGVEVRAFRVGHDESERKGYAELCVTKFKRVTVTCAFQGRGPMPEA